MQWYVAGEEIRAGLVVELRADGKLYAYDTGTPADKIIGINPMLVQASERTMVIRKLGLDKEKRPCNLQPGKIWRKGR